MPESYVKVKQDDLGGRAWKTVEVIPARQGHGRVLHSD